MKRLNLIFALSALVILTGACKQKPSTTVQSETTEPEYSTVEDILQNADSLSGKTVNVSGIIDRVCKHGNKRFKILSSDGNLGMKIELGENFEMPNPDITGKTAKITGTLTPVNINADVLKAWINKEKTEHKEDDESEHLKKMEGILNQIESGEIPYYTFYSIQADKYELE